MAVINLPTADFVTTTLNGAVSAGATSATIGTGLSIPATNGILQVDYDSSAAVGADNGPETWFYTAYTTGTGAVSGLTRGYAGTTDVLHANGASVQAGPSVKYWELLEDFAAFWVNPSETWVYASASTFTITGIDRTSIYQKGTKLRFKQGAGYKYATVASSSFATDTTVTIIVNTDYTIANAAITDNYYSYAENPQGFPHWFVYTPTMTSSNADFVLDNGTVVGRYSVRGRNVTARILYTRGSGTTNGTGDYRWTTPTSISTTIPVVHGSSEVRDSGASNYSVYPLYGATTYIVAARQVVTTHTGTAPVINLILAGTGLITWAAGDVIAHQVTYEMA